MGGLDRFKGEDVDGKPGRYYGYPEIDDVIKDPGNRESSTEWKFDRSLNNYYNSDPGGQPHELPFNWPKHRGAFFSALKLPESIGYHMFIAVCLRYMKYRPNLLRDRLKKSKLPKHIPEKLLNYLRKNQKSLEGVYGDECYGNLEIVDDHFEMRRNKKGDLTGIVVPDNVRFYYNFRSFYEANEHTLPKGKLFRKYLDEEFKKSLRKFTGDKESPKKGDLQARSDGKEDLGPNELLFREEQDLLYRLLTEHNTGHNSDDDDDDSSGHGCFRHRRAWLGHGDGDGDGDNDGDDDDGNKWGDNVAYMPLSKHKSKYIGWYRDEVRDLEDYFKRDSDEKFAGQKLYPVLKGSGQGSSIFMNQISV